MGNPTYHEKFAENNKVFDLFFFPFLLNVRPRRMLYSDTPECGNARETPLIIQSNSACLDGPFSAPLHPAPLGEWTHLTATFYAGYERCISEFNREVTVHLHTYRYPNRPFIAPVDTLSVHNRTYHPAGINDSKIAGYNSGLASLSSRFAPNGLWDRSEGTGNTPGS